MPISPELLCLLRQARYDPSANRGYDHFSGGFHWSDKFPEGFTEAAIRLEEWPHRKLIAHRAAIILGEDLGRFREIWQEVERDAPGWPGLRKRAPGPEPFVTIDRKARRSRGGAGNSRPRNTFVPASHLTERARISLRRSSSSHHFCSPLIVLHQ